MAGFLCLGDTPSFFIHIDCKYVYLEFYESRLMWSISFRWAFWLHETTYFFVSPPHDGCSSFGCLHVIKGWWAMKGGIFIFGASIFFRNLVSSKISRSFWSLIISRTYVCRKLISNFDHMVIRSDTGLELLFSAEAFQIAIIYASDRSISLFCRKSPWDHK